MTETDGPSATEQQQDYPPPPPAPGGVPPGVDRAHLRSYERLRRSVADRKIAGVAGGLGQHLNIDPTVLRVLFVVLCFFGGAGFLLYGVAWLLVPEAGRDEGHLRVAAGTRNGLLIATGVVAALLLVGDGWGGVGFPWPLLLLGLGVALYLVLRGEQGATTRAPSGDRPPGDQAPPWEPDDPSRPDLVTPGPGDPTGPPPWAPVVPAYEPPTPRRRGPLLFGPTLALVALALGLLGILQAVGLPVTPSAYPALALAVVGVMLVVGSVLGRPGGLVLLGLVAAMALAVTTAVGAVGDVVPREGDRLVAAPGSASAVRDSYRVDTGQVSLDLTRLSDPEALAGRRITLSASIGEVLVTLPDGVRSRVLAEVDGPGQVDLPDRSSGGIGTRLSGNYGSGPGVVTIDTRLSAGHIDVRSLP